MKEKQKHFLTGEFQWITMEKWKILGNRHWNAMVMISNDRSHQWLLTWVRKFEQKKEYVHSLKVSFSKYLWITKKNEKFIEGITGHTILTKSSRLKSLLLYISIVNSLLSVHSPSVLSFSIMMCCSMAELCPTLCDPMDCSTPGFPALLSPGACSNSYPLSRWCHPTTSSSHFSSHPQSFPASGCFPMN